MVFEPHQELARSFIRRVPKQSLQPWALRGTSRGVYAREGAGRVRAPSFPVAPPVVLLRRAFGRFADDFAAMFVQAIANSSFIVDQSAAEGNTLVLPSRPQPARERG
ncbi:MAG TPA: hypothetical protein VKC66_19805 [Xanthobacteraceae bacterium]|nr:hypothetical protein [Xanthobacteraceae bacterium]